MPIRVLVPGHGIVEFPDGTSEQEMREALRTLPPGVTPARRSSRTWTDAVIDALPAAGVDSSQGSAIGRFLEGAVRTNPVTSGVEFLTGLVTGETPRAVLEASAPYVQHARESAQHGQPAAALGNLASATPMVGPYVRGAIDLMRSGDVAGGLGELSWMALPVAKTGVRTGTGAAVDLAKRVAPDLTTRAADLTDRFVTNQMTRVMSPQVGPNKTRLGNKAAEVAPDLLRDPGLSAFSRGGLATRVSQRLDHASEGLDRATEARLVSQQVKTEPLLRAIDAQIATLTAHPVEASAFPRGRQTEPYGRAVEPSPNSAQIATLRRIRTEIAQLGPVAPFESIRRIRQAWDQVAKVKFLPATAQDALQAQGDATGAVKGTAALREALALTDPQTAHAFQTYSLYKSAHDVLQAAEEAERVRPNRGRGIMARTAGAMIGAHEGGVVGAGIGAVVAGIADRAAEMAPTFQIMTARMLAGVADALRSGDVERAQVITDRLVHKFPAVKTGLRIVGRTSAMGGRAMRGVPQAAGNENTPGQ